MGRPTERWWKHLVSHSSSARKLPTIIFIVIIIINKPYNNCPLYKQHGFESMLLSLCITLKTSCTVPQMLNQEVLYM